ncbi:thioredoxin-like protein 1 [Topomyia yanbarensis]|uniref:thioredoxin-like protein 1 n=1 Tax=Topomyia yanbarensis TaxID=2498891 RepID=UPI00273AB67F|nr:thioredoxin-like protein 1 [Topomyia yanbarensis]
MAIKAITDEAHFQTELAAARGKLFVVDFTAAWCGPCRNLSHLFDQLPAKYPKAVFLKADVDRCTETAPSQDINGREAKIQKHYVASLYESGEDYGHGMLYLNTFIQKNQCECLNESNDHPMVNALSSSGGHLVSDCDEQLIISITFNQLVKISAIKFKAPPSHGPKKVSVQDLVLGQKDLVSGSPIPLHLVKFQNVQNMQLFVKDNHSEATQLNKFLAVGHKVLNGEPGIAGAAFWWIHTGNCMRMSDYGVPDTQPGENLLLGLFLAVRPFVNGF